MENKDKSENKKKKVYPEDLQKVILTTRQILMYLVDFSVGVFEYGDKNRIYRCSIRDYWQWRDLDKERFSKDLYRLKREKLIRVYLEGKEKHLELTEKGREKVKNYLVEDLTITIPREWDHRWRIVIFDIPEDKKLARDILVNKLKNLGFLRIQKSVYVFPYDCKKEIDYLKELYEIGPYVQYIAADRIDTEIALLRCFYDNNVLK